MDRTLKWNFSALDYIKISPSLPRCTFPSHESHVAFDDLHPGRRDAVRRLGLEERIQSRRMPESTEMARRFTATPAYAVVTLVRESVSKRISLIRKSFILSHSQVDVRANSARDSEH